MKNYIRILIVFVAAGLLVYACSKEMNGKNGGAGIKDSAEIEGVTEIELDTAVFAVLKYNYDNFLFDSLEAVPTELDEMELLVIESLVMQAVDEHNIKMKDKYKDDSVLTYRMIELQNYKRQYIPVKDEKGNKYIWVNCFCDDFGIDWRNEPLYVKDGGDCYFNFYINLAEKKYYGFRVNGEA